MPGDPTTGFLTMLFTGGAFIAAAIYAWLTYKLLRSSRAASEAATLTQLVQNNRSLAEYAARDASLMAVLRGDVTVALTPQQAAFVSMVTSQVMCCFECSRLGVLPDALFQGIKLAFSPMLSNKIIATAVEKTSAAHPDLKKLIETWIEELKKQSSVKPEGQAEGRTA
jgi:hypothetical protein